MDVETILVSVGVVAISAMAITAIFCMFGFKEKTYEEAIAEQRKFPEESLLMSRNTKEKSKEKKHKKSNKKVKEKQSDHDRTNQRESIEKVRVEFEKPEAEIISDRILQDESKKNKKKRDRVKPILVNRDEPPLVVETPVLVANHFEEIHPKDDLLLKRKESKEEINSKGYERTVAEGDTKNSFDKDHVGKNEKPASVKAEKVSKGEKSSAAVKCEKPSQVIKPEKNQTGPKTDKGKEVNDVEKPAVQLSEKDKTPVEKVAVSMKQEKNSPKAEKNTSSAKSDKIQNPLKEEKTQGSSKTEKPQSHDPEKSLAQPKSESAVSPPVAKAERALINSPSIQENGHHVVANKEQRTKKKRNELTALQQLSVNNEGINVSLLLPLINKAELSRSEIQIMIDLLLNKQQGVTVGNSEWVEGRQDPVMKLKKQLSEAEKALAVKQEESLNHQNKLKELRLEYNSERSRLNQSCRQLEEALIARQGEVQALTARLQHASDIHTNEKQALSQQLQQLQAQYNEDRILLRKLQEERDQSQEILQQELLNQRQQLELHIAQLGESEAAYKAQVNQLHSKLQEQNNVIIESQRAKDNEIKVLREQLGSVQNSVDKCKELSKQLEELNRLHTDAESKLQYSCQVEKELENRISNLQSELDEAIEEAEQLKQQLGSSESILSQKTNSIAEIKSEVEFLRRENESLNAQVSSLSQHKLELEKIKEENEFLSSQIASLSERPAAEGRENGDLHHSEQMFLENEKLVKEKDEIEERLSSKLKERETMVEKLVGEINSYKTEIKSLKQELEEQRGKNNALRTKNWKVMEALSAAEKSLENKMKSSEKLVSEASERMCLEQQTSTKQLLQRIFPEINIDNVTDYDTWIERFEISARNLLKEINASPKDDKDLEEQIVQLQGANANYKTVIQDTEGMLSKLQKQVDDEDLRWRELLRSKELEIEGLKEMIKQGPGDKLQSEIVELKTKLQQAELQNEELHNKYEELVSNSRSDVSRNQHLAALQMINEEREHLSSQFETEKLKKHNLTTEDSSQLKCQLQNGNLSANSDQSLLNEEVNHTSATNGSTIKQSMSKAMQSLIKRKQKNKTKKGSSTKK